MLPVVRSQVHEFVARDFLEIRHVYELLTGHHCNVLCQVVVCQIDGQNGLIALHLMTFLIDLVKGILHLVKSQSYTKEANIPACMCISFF